MPENRGAIVMTDPETRNHKLMILMPVYNDWGALSILLPSLDRELNVEGLNAEILAFRFFYRLYQLIHFLLTGVKVRVGNFSVILWPVLKRLVVVSELWNHYAVAVHKARLPMALVPTQRGKRLEGPSHMNLIALVTHGLSAMAVFGDRIGVRLLIVVSLGMVLAGGALIGVVGIRLLTTLAIPGWATYVSGILLVMLVQMLLVILVFAFVILAARDTASFIPGRDYVYLTDGVQRVYGNGR